MKPSIFPLTALLAALALGASGAVQATLLLDITASTGIAGGPNAGSYVTVGYKFTLSQPSQVTSLGIWDQDGDGLVFDHDVGLWTSDGSTLLALVTVPQGTGTTFVASADTGVFAGSGWRFTSLNSLLNLAAGDYVLGAEYYRPISGSYDRYISGGATIQMASGSTFVQDRGSASYGSTNLTFPSGTANTFDSNFGPNLLMATQQVPEPGSIALVGLGLAGLFGFGRRKAT